MASVFWIRLSISSNRPELEDFVKKFSPLLGGELRRHLVPGTRRVEGTDTYWTSRYFTTSLDHIADDLVSLLGLIPVDDLRPFAGSIAVSLIDRYQKADDRHGLYLSREVVQAMAAVGAYFDYDVGGQLAEDAGKYAPVPTILVR